MASMATLHIIPARDRGRVSVSVRVRDSVSVRGKEE